jgi:hypothetical protein
MFLPVACLKCGKLFQVPETAAGTDVACPWCKQSTAALPVAAVAADVPLSLDDAEPVEPRREKKRRSERSAPEPKKSGRSLLAKLAIGGVLSILVLVATLAILRYGSGEISPAAWAEFTPQDGSCSIQLPGTPVEEANEPRADETVTRGLHVYTTTGWYSRARVWIGWRDLDPAWVKQAKEDRDGAITNPVLTGERHLDEGSDSAVRSEPRAGSVDGHAAGEAGGTLRRRDRGPATAALLLRH